MPGTRNPEVVVLTTHADEASILDALGAGARGYLTKDAGIAEISRAVHAAAAHQTLLDPVVQQQLLAAAPANAAPEPAVKPRPPAKDRRGRPLFRTTSRRARRRCCPTLIASGHLKPGDRGRAVRQ